MSLRPRSITLPPTDVLPTDLRGLADEFEQLRSKLAQAEADLANLRGKRTRDAAIEADKQAAADAVRAGDDPPGPEHVTKLEQDLEAAEQRAADVLAALNQTWADLRPRLVEAAPDQHTEATDRLADLEATYRTALEALADARHAWLEGVALVGYWKTAATLDGQGTLHFGRRQFDRASNVSIEGEAVPVEQFERHAEAFHDEIARIARRLDRTKRHATTVAGF